jgi:putative FmdB family regulatory protein
MPTYDYECDACGHTFEQFQGIMEDPLKKCPSCKKAKLRRLFGTGAAIVFKGSGFYQTDYRSDSYKKSAKADKDSSSSSSSSSSSGSDKSSSDTSSKASSADSKPAAKPKKKKAD